MTVAVGRRRGPSASAVVEEGLGSSGRAAPTARRPPPAARIGLPFEVQPPSFCVERRSCVFGKAASTPDDRRRGRTPRRPRLRNASASLDSSSTIVALDGQDLALAPGVDRVAVRARRAEVDGGHGALRAGRASTWKSGGFSPRAARSCAAAEEVLRAQSGELADEPVDLGAVGEVRDRLRHPPGARPCARTAACRGPRRISSRVASEAGAAEDLAAPEVVRALPDGRQDATPARRAPSRCPRRARRRRPFPGSRSRTRPCGSSAFLASSASLQTIVAFATGWSRP